MNFNPKQPHDLRDLPPSVDIESKKILKQCIKSRDALASLKSIAKIIPNQAILINTIPMLEAKASSEIENIVTTEDELFRYSESFSNSKTRSSTVEAYRYQTALSKGFYALKNKPICTNLAIEVCSIIKDQNMNIRPMPGTAIANPSTRDIIYTPPVGETAIREKLANWEKFIYEYEDIDPLIRMAISHYQFEAIHPFSDGNGRTGRVLNILFIIQEGLLDTPILYLSRFINQNKPEYYDLLLSVTKDQQWEEWILYMLRAVEETAKWTSSKIEAVKNLFDSFADYVKKKEPKIYSKEMIEVLFYQPYCRISNFVKNNIAKRETASIYLRRLCDIGVLNEIHYGKEKLFINHALFGLLTQNENDVSFQRDDH